MSRLEYTKIDNPENHQSIFSNKVRLKQCGDIVEVLQMSRWNNKCNIIKLNDAEYIHVDSGEIREFVKAENRSQSRRALKKTFETIRDVVNANVRSDNKECVRWLTFTYAENMTDRDRLMKDLEKMRKKAMYQLGKFKYISVVEPQGRGAWHSHEFWIFPSKAPFIDTKWLEEKWGNGFVKVKRVTNVDNQGAYLTAYLGDMPLREALETGHIPNGCEIKEIDVEGEIKRFIKGGRLHLYPNKFNILRTSRGIDRGTKEYTSCKKAKEKVGSAKPTFETAYTLKLDNSVDLAICKQYYNMAR